MGLTFGELLRQLEKYSPELIRDCGHSIATVRFFDKKEFSPKTDVLLVGYAKDLPKTPPVGQASFLVVGRSVPVPYREPDAECSLITVDQDITPLSLCNAVLKLLEEKMLLSEKILRLLKVKKNRNSLHELMDIGYEILGNPLLLVDVSLCFLAHAGGNISTEEPLWEWTLNKGYVTDEYIDRIRTDMMTNLAAGDSAANFIWEIGMLNHDQLVYKINDNGKPVAYLKVLALNKPISDSDMELIEALGNAILYYLLESTNTYTPSSPLAESFILALLNEKIYDKDAIEERVRQFNIKLYDYISVIAVELTEEYVQDIDKIYTLKRILQNFLDRNIIVYHDGYLVIIFDTKSDAVFTDSEYLQFQNLLEKQNCRAGISFPSENLHALPEQFSQAVAALNTAWKLYDTNRAIRYSDYLLHHIFLNYAERGTLDHLIHPALKKILQLEKDRRALYLETIRGYIDNGTEISAASRKMFLNYNTLKYRISRVIELTGLDFNDAQTIFQLQLSFLILDIKRKITQDDNYNNPKNQQ